MKKGTPSGGVNVSNVSVIITKVIITLSSRVRLIAIILGPMFDVESVAHP